MSIISQLKYIPEEIMEELDYKSSEVSTKIHVIKIGFQNLWLWRKIIWNDRWWDYSFLDTIVKFKLTQMRDNWDGSHYVGSEIQKELLEELVQILDDIEKLEDEVQTDTKIDEKYKEFGQKLYGINKVEQNVQSDGASHLIKHNCSSIRTLWD